MAEILTPELVAQLVRSVKDYRITPWEFQQIMNTLTATVREVLVGLATGVLVGAVSERFARETAFEVKEIAGVPLPIPERGGKYARTIYR